MNNVQLHSTPSLPQYLLGGLAEIDVNDWKSNTEYSGGYTSNDLPIIWFWKVLIIIIIIILIILFRQ